MSAQAEKMKDVVLFLSAVIFGGDIKEKKKEKKIKDKNDFIEEPTDFNAANQEPDKVMSSSEFGQRISAHKTSGRIDQKKSGSEEIEPSQIIPLDEDDFHDF